MSRMKATGCMSVSRNELHSTFHPKVRLIDKKPGAIAQLL